MKIATLIALGLQASVALNVFCIGLAAIPSDATSLLRRPGILLRAVASIFVVMPLVAVALARAIDPHPAVKIALVTLAVAPCPPIFPRRAIKAGAKRTETVGLLVTAAFSDRFERR
jgi:bile acid:Na+ symporter, BASS family